MSAKRLHTFFSLPFFELFVIFFEPILLPPLAKTLRHRLVTSSMEYWQSIIPEVVKYK